MRSTEALHCRPRDRDSWLETLGSCPGPRETERPLEFCLSLAPPKAGNAMPQRRNEFSLCKNVKFAASALGRLWVPEQNKQLKSWLASDLPLRW